MIYDMEGQTKALCNVRMKDHIWLQKLPHREIRLQKFLFRYLGAFKNYVQNLAILWTPCSDSFYTLSMDKNRHFWPPLPTPHLVHLLSYWMAPYYTLSVNVGITTLAKYIRTIFIFWPILETRTEILQILSFAFWEIWRQDKLPLKLTDL
jgi:hypothetical protein